MTSDSLSGRIEARELIRPELVLAGNDLSVDVAGSADSSPTRSQVGTL